MCAQVSWFTRSSRLPRHASPVSTAKVETVHPLFNFQTGITLLSVCNAKGLCEIPLLTERSDSPKLTKKLFAENCIEPHRTEAPLKHFGFDKFTFAPHAKFARHRR